MKYYNLKCEVPGGIGPETIYDKSIVPWAIKKLHVVLEGWLGGEILTISSCLLVSKPLQRALSFEFSGILRYEHFYLQESENFRIIQPDVQLLEFNRMVVGSNSFKDDFSMVHYNGLYNQLIISDKAKILLEKFNLGNYSIEEAHQ